MIEHNLVINFFFKKKNQTPCGMTSATCEIFSKWKDILSLKSFLEAQCWYQCEFLYAPLIYPHELVWFSFIYCIFQVLKDIYVFFCVPGSGLTTVERIIKMGLQSQLVPIFFPQIHMSILVSSQGFLFFPLRAHLFNWMTVSINIYHTQEFWFCIWKNKPGNGCS